MVRGALIDEEALLDAPNHKRIAMAGLDVYRREQLPAESPLRTPGNVVLLPAHGRRLLPFVEDRYTRRAPEHRAFFRRESGRNHQWLKR